MHTEYTTCDVHSVFQGRAEIRRQGRAVSNRDIQSNPGVDPAQVTIRQTGSSTGSHTANQPLYPVVVSRGPSVVT